MNSRTVADTFPVLLGGAALTRVFGQRADVLAPRSISWSTIRGRCFLWHRSHESSPSPGWRAGCTPSISPRSTVQERIDVMRAVLWDMDGRLVDSEKLWDIGIQEFYRRHDSELSAEVRASTVGGSAETVIGIVYADLGLEPD